MMLIENDLGWEIERYLRQLDLGKCAVEVCSKPCSMHDNPKRGNTGGLVFIFFFSTGINDSESTGFFQPDIHSGFRVQGSGGSRDRNTVLTDQILLRTS